MPSCRKVFHPDFWNQEYCGKDHQIEFNKLAHRIGVNFLRGDRGGRHIPSYKTSPSLRRLLSVLKDGRWYTTRELGELTRLQNIATWVSALNHPKNGFTIVCEYVRRTEGGGKVYRYRLER